MKTNSFLTKSLLLLAVLSITSLSTAQASSKNTKSCSVKNVTKNKASCKTSEMWFAKNKTFWFSTIQRYKGFEDAPVKYIYIRRNGKTVRKITPLASILSRGTGSHKVLQAGRYSMEIVGRKHRKGSSIQGAISRRVIKLK